MESCHAPFAPPPLSAWLDYGLIALFLDFDGTLVDLAATPDSISPVPDLANRLAALAERMGGSVALVSGRGLDDIARHLGRLPVAGAGSHGEDMRDGSGVMLGADAKSLPDPIAQEMRRYAQENGLGFEEKPHGAALHYRSKEDAGPDANDFAEALAREHGWTTQNGKCVIELVAGQADKGSAVRTFMQVAPFKGARPVFIGDDLTDEQGFAVCLEMGGAGILVGARRKSVAQYHLPDVASVHRWLNL